WPRAIDLLLDLVACELFWVVDEQTDDLCVVVAFVPQFEREVVVAPNSFRNRTELGEADAETGQPACAVAHLLPVRLPPRVAVLLEQVEDLGLRHGTSLLSTDPRQRATWQGSRTMAGAQQPPPRWQPWVLCAVRRCRCSLRPRCRSHSTTFEACLEMLARDGAVVESRALDFSREHHRPRVWSETSTNHA